jgi:UDP-glucose:(heptosyl)LPS alpha-1,3-glucosyltransferase
MNTADSHVARLRIAVLNRTFVSTGGGAERYSIALVEQLSGNHDVHVFAQEIGHTWPGVTYHRLWTPLVKPRWINQLWYAVTSWWATRSGFDVVHSHENTWHGQVQTVHVMPVKYNLFNGRRGVRLALRWLKVVTSPRLLTYLWLEKMRFAIANGRQIIATSPSLRDRILQCYPSAAPILGVLTPGVNCVPGLCSPSERAEARYSLGLPIAGRCILFVANDYEKKGLHTLLSALRQLPANTYLTVVGNDAHVATFDKVARELGVDARVFFLGALKDMTPAYATADCLVHPTLEDTYAMVVLEAMSHGLPTIVSAERYCGIAGMLKNKVDALILDNPLDAEALARMIERLLTDFPLGQRLSRNGTEWARKFLWSEIALLQEKIYANVMTSRVRT